MITVAKSDHMHIGDKVDGEVRTLCGLTLHAGDGAALDAMRCPTCVLLSPEDHPWRDDVPAPSAVG